MWLAAKQLEETIAFSLFCAEFSKKILKSNLIEMLIETTTQGDGIEEKLTKHLRKLWENIKTKNPAKLWVYMKEAEKLVKHIKSNPFDSREGI